MLNLNAQHIGHGGGVNEVDVGGAVFAVVIVLPVFHEEAQHLMALAFEQVGGDGGIDTPAQADHDALFARGGIKRAIHG